MPQKYKEFALRALSVAAVALVTYVSTTVSGVVDPSTAAIVTAVCAAVLNVFHANAQKT